MNRRVVLVGGVLVVLAGVVGTQMSALQLASELAFGIRLSEEGIRIKPDGGWYLEWEAEDIPRRVDQSWGMPVVQAGYEIIFSQQFNDLSDPVTRVPLGHLQTLTINLEPGERWFLAARDTMIEDTSNLITIDVLDCGGVYTVDWTGHKQGGGIYQMTTSPADSLPNYPEDRTWMIYNDMAHGWQMLSGEKHVRFRGWDEESRSWYPWSGLVILNAKECPDASRPDP